MEHTPKPSSQLPWWVEVDSDSTWIESLYFRVADSLTNEDAEFIVIACNSFTALLEACKIALPELELDARHSKLAELDSIVEIMRQAIAQAEGRE